MSPTLTSEAVLAAKSRVTAKHLADYRRVIDAYHVARRIETSTAIGVVKAHEAAIDDPALFEAIREAYDVRAEWDAEIQQSRYEESHR